MKVESCEGHSRHRWSACKKRPRLSARSLFFYFHSRQLAPTRALPWKTRFLGPGLNPLNPPHALHIAHPHIAAQRDRSLQSLRATEPPTHTSPPAPSPATRVILSTVPSGLLNPSAILFGSQSPGCAASPDALAVGLNFNFRVITSHNTRPTPTLTDLSKRLEGAIEIYTKL